jgi:hypothetical protein
MHFSEQQVAELDKVIALLDKDQKNENLRVPEELNKLLEGMSKSEREAALSYINAELHRVNPLVTVGSWDPWGKGDELNVTHRSASGNSAFGQEGRCIGKPVEKKLPALEIIDYRALIGS